MRYDATSLQSSVADHDSETPPVNVATGFGFSTVVGPTSSTAANRTSSLPSVQAASVLAPPLSNRGSPGSARWAMAAGATVPSTLTGPHVLPVRKAPRTEQVPASR